MPVTPPSATRNLLVCFDAFGTLFRPRAPIAHQYGDVARSFGLRGFRDEDVGRAFKTAFKQESARNPNYGKQTGLDPERWWTNVITATFSPLTQQPQLPPGMAHALLHRFSSSTGYELFDDAGPLLRQLRGLATVGVITNSDPRVRGILQSLGLALAPAGSLGRGDWDVDFCVTSYETGASKPEGEIFRGAEAEAGWGAGSRRMVYVGDEYEKDVVGALGAGWDAVWICRDGGASRRERVMWLEDEPVGDLFEALDRGGGAVGFGSLARLGEWLFKGT